MTRSVLVDIGNSRMKWGRVVAEAIEETAVLDLDDRESWAAQAKAWELDRGTAWRMASVNPPALDRFRTWLGDEPADKLVLDSHRGIPLPLDVETPEAVGPDRLLACLAAKALLPLTPSAGGAMREVSGKPFLVVQAGTAIVVNLVNAAGAFAGGAILPGLSLMAKALHEHTALLPEVSVREAVESVPGRTTEAAIRTGIFWSAVGAILTLRAGFDEIDDLPIFLTGGDAEVLLPAIPEPVSLVPDLVLEGILLAGGARP